MKLVMEKVNPTIARLEAALEQDPFSKVFAPLAESYRQLGLLAKAEQVAQNGVKRNPKYAAGWVSYARVLIDESQYDEALQALSKATDLESKNVLAHQLMGDVHLKTSNPALALKSYKMALFLAPMNEKVQKAVQKLETLSATDFDSSELKRLVNRVPLSQKRDFESTLSILDAFLFRNDLNTARDFIRQLPHEYIQRPEIAQRMEMLGSKDVAEPIHPLPSREKEALLRKVKSLESFSLAARKLTPI